MENRKESLRDTEERREMSSVYLIGVFKGENGEWKGSSFSNISSKSNISIFQKMTENFPE